MSRRTLPDIFRSLISKAGKPRRRPAGFRPQLEGIEDRVVPATLPTPTVLTPTATLPSVALPQVVPGSSTVNYFNPQVVANPTNPLQQVMVATSVTNSSAGTFLGVVAQ